MTTVTTRESGHSVNKQLLLSGVWLVDTQAALLKQSIMGAMQDPLSFLKMWGIEVLNQK